MFEAMGYFCFYLFGILLSVSSVTGSHRRYGHQYQSNYYYYYYYYYEYDGNASMIAGSVIGGLIALCIIIAVIVVLVHACNCCKTHGVRGHTIRPQITTVTTAAPYNNMPHNNWYYLPATAPPYNPNTSKPPEYSINDSNPPPSYDDVSVPTAPANTSLQQPGISSPVPPYSPPGPTAKSS